jgi:hypothetical protein
MHYKRWLRYGTVGPVGRWGKRASLEDRFHDRVRYGTEPPYCLIWGGAVHKASGFGVIWIGHRLLYAHRVAYELARGVRPPGKVIQTCGNRLCVRDDHLDCRRAHR